MKTKLILLSLLFSISSFAGAGLVTGTLSGVSSGTNSGGGGGGGGFTNALNLIPGGAVTDGDGLYAVAVTVGRKYYFEKHGTDAIFLDSNLGHYYDYDYGFTATESPVYVFVDPGTPGLAVTSKLYGPLELLIADFEGTGPFVNNTNGTSYSVTNLGPLTVRTNGNGSASIYVNAGENGGIFFSIGGLSYPYGIFLQQINRKMVINAEHQISLSTTETNANVQIGQAGLARDTVTIEGEGTATSPLPYRTSKRLLFGNSYWTGSAGLAVYSDLLSVPYSASGEVMMVIRSLSDANSQTPITNMLFKTTNNVSTVPFLYRAQVLVKTVNYDVSTNDCGAFFCNGSTGIATTNTLPQAVVGLGPYSFTLTSSQFMAIKATSPDVISVLSTSSTSGGGIYQNTISSTVTLVCFKTGFWYATSQSGTWSGY